MSGSEVQALKSLFSVATARSEIATALVVGGVFIELVVLLFDKGMSRLEKRILVPATALVVLGVAGEWVFGGQATSAASRLQQISDQNVAALQRAQASDHRIASVAAAHAADLGVTVNDLQGFVSQKQRVASERMSALKQMVDVDRQRTASAVATLNADRGALEKARRDALIASGTATQDLSVMQRQVGQIDALLNQEQALHDRLEAVLTPRSLSSDQRAAIIRELKPFAPMRVAVILFGDTPEVGNFGRELADTFTRADWTVSLFSAVGGAAMSVQGVPILVRKGDVNADSCASALEHVLLSQRISAKVVGAFSGTEIPVALVGGVWDGTADLRVYVGAKP